MNRDVLDTTVSVYVLGIREGYRRAAELIRSDIVKNGRTEDLYEITEYFANLILGASEC